MQDHKAVVTAIVKQSAHSESDIAHQDLHAKLQQAHEAVAAGHGHHINWDDWEDAEVKKLDAQAHEAHTKSVHKMAEQGKNLPDDEQDSFMNAASKSLQSLGKFMSDAFEKLSAAISSALAKISSVISGVVEWVKHVVDSVVSYIKDAISSVTNWATSNAMAITEWVPVP